MAITYVQANSALSATGTSMTCAYSSNVTAGNLLVVAGMIINIGSPVGSISDTLGNSWTLAATQTGTGSGYVWFCITASSGANTATFGFGGTASGGDYCALTVAEYTTTSKVLSTDGTANGGGNAVTSLTLTTGSAIHTSDLVAGMAFTGGFSGNTGVIATSVGTVRTSQASLALIYWDSTSIGTGAQTTVLTKTGSGFGCNGLLVNLGSYPAPTCTGCSANSGASVGGTSVTITGTGFVATPTVTFGGTAATSVTWVSATSLTCVTPAGSIGVVNVVVTNPDTQTGTDTNCFTYVPVVQLNSPLAGISTH
jgi:hypothetical protein